VIKLHRLKVDGFRQLREIDLAIPDRCQVLVEGENEAGKSTLFEAVYFALYGDSITRATQEDLISNRLLQGYVALEFSADGARLEVLRQLRRSKSRTVSQAQLRVTRADGTVEEVNRATDVNREILAYLHGLDAEALRHSCYVEQKGLDRFASELTPDKRQNILLKLLDQDRLLFIRKHFARARPDEREIERVRRLVKLARTWRDLRECGEKIETARRRLTLLDLADTLQQLAEQSRKFQKESERHEALSADARKIEARISTVGRWQDAAGFVRQLADARGRVIDLERRREKVNARLAELARLENETLPAQRAQKTKKSQAVEAISRYMEKDQTRGESIANVQRLREIQTWEVHSEALRGQIRDIRVRLEQKKVDARQIGERLEQARQARARADKAAVLRAWARAKLQVAADQQQLHADLAALNLQIEQGQAQYKAATDTAAQFSRRRWLALAPSFLGAILLLVALVIGIGFARLAAPLGLVAVGLALTGVVLLGVGVWVFMRAARQMRMVQAQAGQHDATVRELQNRRAGTAAQVEVFERQAEGILAVPRARLIESGLVEPEPPEDADTQAAEYEAQAAGIPSNVDELERAARDADKSVTETEQEMVPLSATLRERDAQLASRLRAESLSEYGDVPQAIVRAQAEADDCLRQRDMATDQLKILLTEEYLSMAPAELADRLKREAGELAGTIRSNEEKLHERSQLEAEGAGVAANISEEQERIDQAGVHLQDANRLDPSIPLPRPGEEGQAITDLTGRVKEANLAALRSEHHRLIEDAGAAAQAAKQAKLSENTLSSRVWSLLGDLGIVRDESMTLDDALQRLSELPQPDPRRRAMLEGELRQLQVEESRAKRDCAELVSELNISPETIDETTETARLDELLKQQRVCRLADAVLDCTRRNLLDRLLPDTLEHARRFLPLLTNGRYFDAELDDRSFQLRVWDAQFNRMVQRELFSGGAQDQFALALRLGFAIATLPQEMGAAPAFIFLDEPVASFDRMRREAFVNLVREGEIGRRFDQIFISEPEGIFPENPFPHFIRMQGGRIVEVKIPTGVHRNEPQ
jgi:exonuclease SbcC